MYADDYTGPGVKYFNIAVGLYERERFDDAEEFFIKAKRVEHGDLPEADYYLSSLYWSHGRLNKAIESFKQVISNIDYLPDAEHSCIRTQYVKCQSDYAEITKKISILKFKIRKDRKNAELYFNLSNFFWQLDMFRQAIASMRLAIKYDPLNRFYYSKFSHLCFFATKEHKNVMEECNLTPYTWECHNELGESYYIEGQIECERIKDKTTMSLDLDNVSQQGIAVDRINCC